MKKRLLNIIIILVVFAFLVYFLQNKIIFIPFRLDGPPRLPEIPGRTLEHVVFQSEDGKNLHGVWLGMASETSEASGTILPTLLFSHGNAGNITHRFERITALATLPVNIFLYDYRGYGQSEGSPTVPGAVMDGDAALRYLIEKRGIPIEKVVFYGESVGSGITMAVAGKHLSEVKAIVLESGFRSLSDRAGKRIPLIGSLILTHDLPNVRTLSGFNGPLLVIHSHADEVIPFEDGEALFAACPSSSKWFFKMDKVGHNDGVWLYPGYMDAWRTFLAAAFPGK